MINFIQFRNFPKIPKKSTKRFKTSNRGTNSLELVRALTRTAVLLTICKDLTSRSHMILGSDTS